MQNHQPTSQRQLDTLLETVHDMDDENITILKQDIVELKASLSEHLPQTMSTAPLNELKFEYFQQRRELGITYDQLGEAFEQRGDYEMAVIAYWKSSEWIKTARFKKEVKVELIPLAVSTSTMAIDLTHMDPIQCLYLGLQYLAGLGVPQNDHIALQCFQRAADDGNSSAQCYLGWMYEKARGVVVRDERRALHWYRLSASHGNAEGQFSLGRLLATAREIERDERQAVYWYQLSASQGNVEAQYFLGASFDAKNVGQAQHWYRLLVEQEVMSARYMLMKMYEAGQGLVEEDVATSYRRDHQNGIQFVDQILKRCKNELRDFESAYHYVMVTTDVLDARADLHEACQLIQTEPDLFFEMLRADEFLSIEARQAFETIIYRLLQRAQPSYATSVSSSSSTRTLSDENYGQVVYELGKVIYALPLLRTSPQKIQEAISFYQQVPATCSCYKTAMSDLYDLESIAIFEESEILHTRVLQTTQNLAAAATKRDHYVQIHLAAIHASFFHNTRTAHNCLQDIPVKDWKSEPS